jgi:hypothetical protein
MISEPFSYIWPPINVKDIFRCSFQRLSSHWCTKQSSRSSSGAPSTSSGRPHHQAVFSLLFRCSFLWLPSSGRPHHQAVFPLLFQCSFLWLPSSGRLRCLAVFPLKIRRYLQHSPWRAYHAATETSVGQNNHQKWCLSPGSVDLCNLSPFRHCTRLYAPLAVAATSLHTLTHLTFTLHLKLKLH